MSSQAMSQSECDSTKTTGFRIFGGHLFFNPGIDTLVTDDNYHYSSV